ncbi:MAG TPA: cytochrome c [Xanthobacteraceae bacterium]|jgi:mono/diheme cytochrome c family protein|nr:cytochrome c [Xanthobacteraceae bacterium]
MRKRLLVLALLAGVASLGVARVAGAEAIDAQKFDQVEKGHYLTVAGDCAACHTAPGSSHDFAGGRVIETPFGKIIAPNITPDRVTGIGAWTDDEFVNAMVKGTGRNGAHLFPAMPYTYYTKVTRDDALAIRAFLNTIPAVHNTVEPDQLPFPLSIRAGMIGWNTLFFTPGAFKPNPDKSAEWNRGAYLAEGLAHCGMCHTSKNFLGGDKTSARYEGYDLQGWFAPNITSDKRIGIGNWSVDELADYLKTGHTQAAAASGLMGDEVDLSTSHLRDEDLKAIATYLKDQSAPSPNQAQSLPSDQPIMKAGAQIYADECAACHKSDGKGEPGLFPALRGAAVVQQADPASLLHVVIRGAQSVSTKPAPTGAAMPAFSWVLTDDQIAAVVTYIRNAWGNAASAVVASEAGKARASLAERND